MSGSCSPIGFGYQPFGNFPFGHADWAEELLYKLIPEFYRYEDTIRRGRVDEPLRRFVDSIKPLFQELREKFDNFPNLWDADEIPLAQLPALAYNFGVDSTTDKDEIFQRLEILNAVQLYLNKGTDKGYQIAASFEGLAITITPLWAENCNPDPELFETGPTQFLPNIDELPSDAISADSVYNDRFAIWPYNLYPTSVIGELFFDEIPLDEIPLDSSNSFSEPRCRSHTLRLFLEKPDDSEIENFNDVSRRVIIFLNKMRPLHVEFEWIGFDGPKATAYWTQTIDADGAAAAYYTSAITGLLSASAYWTGEIVADIAS